MTVKQFRKEFAKASKKQIDIFYRKLERERKSPKNITMTELANYLIDGKDTDFIVEISGMSKYHAEQYIRHCLYIFEDSKEKYCSMLEEMSRDTRLTMIHSYDRDEFASFLFEWEVKKTDTLDDIRKYLDTPLFDLPENREDKENFRLLTLEKEKAENEKYRNWGITAEQAKGTIPLKNGKFGSTLETEFEHLESMLSCRTDFQFFSFKNRKTVEEFVKARSYSQVVIPEIVDYLCRRFEVDNN